MTPITNFILSPFLGIYNSLSIANDAIVASRPAVGADERNRPSLSARLYTQVQDYLQKTLLDSVRRALNIETIEQSINSQSLLQTSNSILRATSDKDQLRALHQLILLYSQVNALLNAGYMNTDVNPSIIQITADQRARYKENHNNKKTNALIAEIQNKLNESNYCIRNITDRVVKHASPSLKRYAINPFVLKKSMKFEKYGYKKYNEEAEKVLKIIAVVLVKMMQLRGVNLEFQEKAPDLLRELITSFKSSLNVFEVANFHLLLHRSRAEYHTLSNRPHDSSESGDLHFHSQLYVLFDICNENSVQLSQLEPGPNNDIKIEIPLVQPATENWALINQAIQAHDVYQARLLEAFRTYDRQIKIDTRLGIPRNPVVIAQPSAPGTDFGPGSSVPQLVHFADRSVILPQGNPLFNREFYPLAMKAAQITRAIMPGGTLKKVLSPFQGQLFYAPRPPAFKAQNLLHAPKPPAFKAQNLLHAPKPSAFRVQSLGLGTRSGAVQTVDLNQLYRLPIQGAYGRAYIPPEKFAQHAMLRALAKTERADKVLATEVKLLRNGLSVWSYLDSVGKHLQAQTPCPDTVQSKITRYESSVQAFADQAMTTREKALTKNFNIIKDLESYLENPGSIITPLEQPDASVNSAVKSLAMAIFQQNYHVFICSHRASGELPKEGLEYAYYEFISRYALMQAGEMLNYNSCGNEAKHKAYYLETVASLNTRKDRVTSYLVNEQVKYNKIISKLGQLEGVLWRSKYKDDLYVWDFIKSRPIEEIQALNVALAVYQASKGSIVATSPVLEKAYKGLLAKRACEVIIQLYTTQLGRLNKSLDILRELPDLEAVFNNTDKLKVSDQWSRINQKNYKSLLAQIRESCTQNRHLSSDVEPVKNPFYISDGVIYKENLAKQLRIDIETVSYRAVKLYSWYDLDAQLDKLPPFRQQLLMSIIELVDQKMHIYKTSQESFNDMLYEKSDSAQYDLLEQALQEQYERVGACLRIEEVPSEPAESGGHEEVPSEPAESGGHEEVPSEPAESGGHEEVPSEPAESGGHESQINQSESQVNQGEGSDSPS